MNGKDWLAEFERKYPGSLRRICGQVGLPYGGALDERVAQILTPIAAATEGPSRMTPAMIGHARSTLGIVGRTSAPTALELPLALPAPAEDGPSPAVAAAAEAPPEDLTLALRRVLAAELPGLLRAALPEALAERGVA